MRSYAEYCAVAKSLDVVGDRWTLLIVRELALRGACRYTDLRNGLPGIASNLLAERLRDLEAAGVVAREAAPPPVATTLFRLTERGAQLRPVIDDLMRWGLPLMVEHDERDAVRSHWLAAALELMLIDRRPSEPPVALELRIGEEPIAIRVHEGAVDVTLGPVEQPDLTLEGASRSIMGVLLGMLEPAAAGVTHQGDVGVLDRVRPAD
jgi:DNA-binding HxlR family transcriptional regulator